MRIAAGVAMVLMGTGVCLAGETIDNPLYKSWATHKPGTSVTTRMEWVREGKKEISETTTTLRAVKPDKVELEHKTITEKDGVKKESPPAQGGAPAKTDAAAATASTQNQRDVKESEAEIEVAGKKITCKVREWKGEFAGKVMRYKWMTSEQVPGFIVRNETVSEEGKQQAMIQVTGMSIK